MKTIQDWLMLIAGVLAAFLGLYDSVSTVVDTQPYWRSSSWSTTAGEVVTAKVAWRPGPWSLDAYLSLERVTWPVMKRRVPVPKVEYRYQAQGREYIGTRVRADGAGDPRKVVNRLKARSDVTVHYDEAHPEHAVLIPGIVSGAILPAAFSTALGVFGLAAVWLSIGRLAGGRRRSERGRTRVWL
jgi:hypothetical protein